MATEHGNVIVRFSAVSYWYDEDRPILDEVDFSVREDAKITVMGQNGAGKSTIFKLLTGALKPNKGGIHIKQGASVAIALQVMPRDRMEETITEFFEKAFPEKMYDLDRRIRDVLETVTPFACLRLDSEPRYLALG